MTNVLVVAEHDGHTLSPATARTLRCAAAIPDAEIAVAVFAEDGRAVAEQAATLDGVRRVLLVEHAGHAHALAALIAPELAELAAGHTHVLAPATTFGRDLLPRVAALLGTTQVSDVMAIESATRFRRPIYAGNAIATVEIAALPAVATVRIASFQPVAAAGAARAPIERVQPAAAPPTHTRFVSRVVAAGDRPDLQSARRVVSGGRGLGNPENFKRIEELAALLGAAVGASRAAVDSGFAPNDLQVGQTGKIIAPELYIAIGISGAIQHLTGIKDARTIVAINKDPEAPIFEVADIGLVGDLFAVLPDLKERLAEALR
ncbi:MAG TPA: electron transfer flavoprotein subunit alpha/FixB family protein [Gammaproteobacteria bacterium]|nr:electron transfer flavoprotein subunit alpha/FixB family protein [Gammaproteobacteria bacterium]